MDAPLSGLSELLAGTLTAAVGILALLLFLIRRKYTDPLLGAFGAFALLYGIRLFFSSELTATMGVSPRTAAWAINTITYLINVPAWVFFWQLPARRWHSIVVWWLGLVSAFAVAGIVSDLVQQTPGTLARHPNNILVLVGLAIMVFAFWTYQGRISTELRILLVGFSVFAAFAANDNLVSLGLVPWSLRVEFVGFAILASCLAYIAATRFFRNEAQLAALERELETARQIQLSLLPGRLPSFGGASVAVRFRPTSAVAGDLYEFLSPEERAVGILVADVSGHGVPAALIASMVKVAAASHSECADEPAQLLTRINRTLCATLGRGFVTAAYVHVDARRGEIAAACAGHPCPLLARAGEIEVFEIGGQGPLLGRFSSAHYEEQRLPVVPGDRIVLFTDGLVEARSPEGEQFGDSRLRSFVAQGRTFDAQEFCDALLNELQAWTDPRRGLELEDDLTLLVADLTEPAALPSSSPSIEAGPSRR